MAAAVPHTLLASCPPELKHFTPGSALQIAEQPQADPVAFPLGLCRTSRGWKAAASSEQLGKTAQDLKLKCSTSPREGAMDEALSTLKNRFVLSLQGQCFSRVSPARVL